MILLYSNMHTLLHGPSVCVFMYGQATESRWVLKKFTLKHTGKQTGIIYIDIFSEHMCIITYKKQYPARLCRLTVHEHTHTRIM